MSKFDLNKEVSLSRYQIIQLILLCVCLGAGLTLLNELLGFVVLGLAILFLLMPIILQIFELGKDKI